MEGFFVDVINVWSQIERTCIRMLCIESFQKCYLGIIHLVRTQNFLKKTNFSYPVIRTRAFAYKGLRNISFLENFTYVLNGWSFTWQHRKTAVLILCYYYWLLIVQFLFQPEVVGTLSSLRELWLDGNKIKQLPPVSSIWIVNL